MTIGSSEYLSRKPRDERQPAQTTVHPRRGRRRCEVRLTTRYLVAGPRQSHRQPPRRARANAQRTHARHAYARAIGWVGWSECLLGLVSPGTSGPVQEGRGWRGAPIGLRACGRLQSVWEAPEFGWPAPYVQACSTPRPRAPLWLATGVFHWCVARVARGSISRGGDPRPSLERGTRPRPTNGTSRPADGREAISGNLAAQDVVKITEIN